MNQDIYIGTSGWFYFHWESFYRDLPSEKWLHFYAKHFTTVEINSTYYHLPTEKTVKHWASRTPKDFIFSVKMSRYVTHVKKLKDYGDGIDKFLQAIAPLKSKLGPILFLLPPSYQINYELLEATLSVLPKNHQYVFEFRNSSWHVPEVYALLRKYKVGWCISDLNGKLSPIEITAPFVYVRLHGPKSAYKGVYSIQTLKKWAKRIQEWNAQGLSVYFYFDNDEKGYAIQDATKLINILQKVENGQVVSPPRAKQPARKRERNAPSSKSR